MKEIVKCKMDVEYVKRFNENFPIFTMMGTAEDEIIDIIKKCLRENNPYEVEYEDGVLY